MAIKKVILHLGPGKTGTSSIQHTLFTNSTIMERNGFRYLTEWKVNHFKKFHNLFASYPVTPIGTVHLGKPLSNIRQQNKKMIETMLRVINTSECETLILSGEYFHDLWLDSTIENMKSFINQYFQSNGIKTSIVYFVRNPLAWLISSLQQQVFSRGYSNKNDDYFDFRMKQYEGVLNLKKHFSDSLLLLKFEDACLDKDGLVGHFLKKIGFPEEELKNINISRINESRCMEVMEFAYYVESVEPRYPYTDYKRENINRFHKDTNSLRNIKGVKFDLSYQSKTELWGRFQETVHNIKKNTGIDYTDYEIPLPSLLEQEPYSDETIQGFVKAFPKLNIVLQKHFLKFFEKKYMETAQAKFKKLHFKDSIPWSVYSPKSVFFSLLRFRIGKNKLYNSVKKPISKLIPGKTKKRLKRALGRG